MAYLFIIIFLGLIIVTVRVLVEDKYKKWVIQVGRFVIVFAIIFTIIHIISTLSFQVM